MKFYLMKKNQIVVAVIGLMLITAGYLNFTNNEQANQILETGLLTDTIDMAEIGDAQLVSTQPANDSSLSNEESKISSAGENQNNTTSQNNEVKDNKENTENENNQGETQVNSNQQEAKSTQTNANTTTDEYFTKSRLERNTMYSQMLESYQKILDKTTISESQKQTAQKEITRINEQQNAIMITENLIKTKGFEDLVIFINDTSINVIIKAKKLKTEEIAQIQNIITRELNADIDDIHISNKQ